MGLQILHCIVVTGSVGAYGDPATALRAAYRKIREIPESVLFVSPIMQSYLPGLETFFIGPDGSKEGWDISDRGNQEREKIIEYLRAEAGLHWVEVQYGHDHADTRVLRHSDEAQEKEMRMRASL